jgi:S1-C subfamily serine protease
MERRRLGGCALSAVALAIVGCAPTELPGTKDANDEEHPGAEPSLATPAPPERTALVEANRAPGAEADASRRAVPAWSVERPSPPPIVKSAAPSRSPAQVYELSVTSVFALFALDATEQEIVARGSAVAVSERHLVTTYQVANAGTSLIIKSATAQGRVAVYAADPERDRCWLVSRDIELWPVRGVRDFDSLRVGETVYSLGMPEDPRVDSAFNRGVVSDKRDHFTVETTARVPPGSLGGGLFDAHGNLVGIVTGSRSALAKNVAIRADGFWK